MEQIKLDNVSTEYLETELKQRYAKQNQDCCTQTVGYAQASNSNLGCETSRPKTRKESNLYRLDQTIYQATVDSEKAAKVRTILDAHPEFFDFIEVLESGLIR